MNRSYNRSNRSRQATPHWEKVTTNKRHRIACRDVIDLTTTAGGCLSLKLHPRPRKYLINPPPRGNNSLRDNLTIQMRRHGTTILERGCDGATPQKLGAGRDWYLFFDHRSPKINRTSTGAFVGRNGKR